MTYIAGDLGSKSSSADLEPKSPFSCKWQMELYNLNPESLDPFFEALSNAFKGGSLFWPKKEPHIAFVCGAAPGAAGNYRDRFLLFNSGLPHEEQVLAISAEATFNKLREYGANPYNLAKLEELIAGISDSVIIFSESPGSLAELGYFSAIPEIRRKSLVVIRHDHQGTSFVVDGPAALISHESRFKPGKLIIADEIIDVSFRTVMGSIAPHRKEKAKRTKIEVRDSFKSYSARERFFILRELIKLFSPLRLKELVYAIGRIFGAYDIDDVHQLLAALMALESKVGIDEDEWLVAEYTNSILESGFNEARTIVYDLYSRELRDRLERGI